MMASRRDCKYCGEPIEFGQLLDGRWAPYDAPGMLHRCPALGFDQDHAPGNASSFRSADAETFAGLDFLDVPLPQGTQVAPGPSSQPAARRRLRIANASQQPFAGQPFESGSESNGKQQGQSATKRSRSPWLYIVVGAVIVLVFYILFLM